LCLDALAQRFIGLLIGEDRIIATDRGGILPLLIGGCGGNARPDEADDAGGLRYSVTLLPRSASMT
jgi:hypothetical protein